MGLYFCADNKYNKMNRIILIGNGFDLAHGLKTSYKDFINWYWGKWFDKLKKSSEQIKHDELFEIKTTRYLDPLSNYFYKGPLSENIYEHIEQIRNASKSNLYITISPLLYRISTSTNTKGWVDIENDYYTMLAENANDRDYIVKLNKHFNVIQDLLVEYLDTIQKEKINSAIIKNDIRRKILAPLSKNEIAETETFQWIHFAKLRGNLNKAESIYRLLCDYEISDYTKEEVGVLLKKEQSAILSNRPFNDEVGKNFLLPERIMLLSFNYTSTADIYIPKNDRFVVNHIHGDLSNQDKIIFGYGDENDDEHQNILKKNDNEYLMHFKTYHYLEMPNYRNLRSFIESAPFQICIMGHSCGLSDRTMLKTLFEHKNCVSIKPYYYKKENGTDNYLDIVQNISRNFTDMSKMRERVVNKTFCEPL